MDVDPPSAQLAERKARFEVKKVRACGCAVLTIVERRRFVGVGWVDHPLEAYVDIVVDNCAICRNHIMDLCIECQANQGADSEGR
jgi:RING-box protein 1